MRDHDREYQDNEARKYAYDFDYRMHGYMLRTLEPHFRKGKALEIGCFEGHFTQRLLQHFDDLTVIEAAATLIETARATLPASVKFIHTTVETAELQPQFEAIFLVHTLEHLDDAVAALARIKHWLTPTGRLFVVVPNADAPSRQIAVKMGLIEANDAVTPAEREHGHRRTYRLATLERDARAAGFTVVKRGGVFFKPFANFQFDQLIKSRIVSEEYLEGCYALGREYPELTASVYVVCTAGSGA